MPPKSKNSISIVQLNECIETLVSPKLAALQAENSSLREMNKLLVQKIDTLLSKIENVIPENVVPENVDPVDPAPIPVSEVSNATPPELSHKSNTLILSDSIFRHVLSSCPKQPGRRAAVVDKFDLDSKGNHAIHKIVVPGATANRLWEEAASLPLPDRLSFSNVIISVGANYPQSSTESDAARDIIDFIDALADLFPTSQIAWSFILPQPGILPGIRNVNKAVYAYCIDNNIDLIWANDFSVFANGPDHVRSLFAHDGIHLNRKGIDIMSHKHNI